MKQIIKIKPAVLYFFLFLLCAAILIGCFLVSNGRLISRYYIWDETDTGMDYFNSLAYAHEGKPYTQYKAIYPPLANLLYFITGQMVPHDISETWETTYENLIIMRQTERDLRLFQSTMLPFLLFIGMACALVGLLVQYVLRDIKGTAARLIPLTIIFSFGFTWGIERGNIILLAFFFSLCFLAFYHSTRKEIRELSYVCLAIAAGLKIYPAFLGLLLVYDKNWKAAWRTILYGIAVFVLPCFFLTEGINGLNVFVDNLFSFGSRGDLGLHHTGSGLQDFYGNILAVVTRILHTEESQLYSFRNVLQWITYVACAFALFRVALFPDWKNWQRITFLCLIMNSFQSGAYYTLVYLLLPLIFFFREEKELSKENLLFFIPLALVSLHIPVFDLETIKMKAFLIQGSVVMLWIVMAILYIKRIKQKRHRGRIRV